MVKVDTIPLIFRRERPEIQTSYNFTDTATGKGYIRHYGMVSSSGAYVLSPNILDSHQIQTSGAISYQQWKYKSAKFNLNMEKPTTIEGQIFAQWTTEDINGTAGVSSDMTFWKISGNNQEKLSFCSGAIHGQNQAYRNMGTTVIPKTLFRAGDTFRAEVSGAIGDVIETAVLWHDPSERVTTTNNARGLGNNKAKTSLIIDIPFKI